MVSPRRSGRSQRNGAVRSCVTRGPEAESGPGLLQLRFRRRAPHRAACRGGNRDPDKQSRRGSSFGVAGRVTARALSIAFARPCAPHGRLRKSCGRRGCPRVVGVAADFSQRNTADFPERVNNGSFGQHSASMASSLVNSVLIASTRERSLASLTPCRVRGCAVRRRAQPRPRRRSSRTARSPTSRRPSRQWKWLDRVYVVYVVYVDAQPESTGIRPFRARRCGVPALVGS